MGRKARAAPLLALLASGLLLLAMPSGRAFALQALAWLLARDLVSGPLSPGLLLVLGGVLVMTVVGLVALFGSALETTAPEEPKPRRVHTAYRLEEAPATHVYRGPRDLEFERGRAAGARVTAKSLDDVLDRMLETEMGEPRIVRSLPSFLKLRLHACRGCGREGVSGSGVDGCAFECGFIESALTRVLGRSAVAHEVRCRNTGAAACEFEVWF